MDLMGLCEQGNDCFICCLFSAGFLAVNDSPEPPSITLTPFTHAFEPPADVATITASIHIFMQSIHSFLFTVASLSQGRDESLFGFTEEMADLSLSSLTDLSLFVRFFIRRSILLDRILSRCGISSCKMA